MYDIIEIVVVSALIVIIHELGHIISFYYYAGKFPSIRLTWYGMILISDEKGVKEFTLRQHAITAFMGIYSGLIYLMFFDFMTKDNNIIYYFFGYFIACWVDLSILFQFFLGKGFRDTKLKYIKVVDNTPCSEKSH